MLAPLCNSSGLPELLPLYRIERKYDMRVLAIASSGLTAPVAVVAADRTIAEYTHDYKKTPSQTLLPKID